MAGILHVGRQQLGQVLGVGGWQGHNLVLEELKFKSIDWHKNLFCEITLETLIFLENRFKNKFETFPSVKTYFVK